MFYKILQMVFVTLLPFLELRASIPLGILVLKMHWSAVFFICVVTNIILGFLLFFLVDKLVRVANRFKPFRYLYRKFVIRTQKKVRPYVEHYGVLGVSIFIGIPLPGSGVYTGVFGAYLLGIKKKDFFTACVLGVLIAGTAVTLITLFGSGVWYIFLKN